MVDLDLIQGIGSDVLSGLLLVTDPADTGMLLNDNI